jgi:hypothetical protein
MESRALPRAFRAVPLILALVATAAAGQDSGDFGARIGLYTKHGQPYFGAEGVIHLGASIFANPNFEYVRLGDTQEFTFNADALYEVPIRGRTRGWVGAGIGLLSSHPDGPGEPSTKDGVGNVFVGIGFETGVGVPYLTAKYVTKKRPEFLLGLGMRF